MEMRVCLQIQVQGEVAVSTQVDGLGCQLGRRRVVSVACVLGPGRVVGQVEPLMCRFWMWAQSGLCTSRKPEHADRMTNRTLRGKEQRTLTKGSWSAGC